MNSMIITGGRVIDPAQNIDRLADVLISDGRIVDVTDRPMVEPPDGYDDVDARGLVVSPGFVDLHTHLREPGFEHKETIETGSLAAATGGFTTICAMPNTEPALDSPDSVAAMMRRAERVAAVRVLPIGAITIGRAGWSLSPMEELAEAGCIGFSDDGDPLSDHVLMLMAQERAGVLGLPIINHAEVHSLVQDGVMNDGNVAKRLGLPGVPSVAESLMVQRDLEMAKSTGGRVHVPHLSVNQSIEHVFRAKDAGLRVTAEVTPHHLTLTEDWVYGLHGASPLRRLGSGVRHQHAGQSAASKRRGPAGRHRGAARWRDRRDRNGPRASLAVGKRSLLRKRCERHKRARNRVWVAAFPRR